MSKVKIGIIGCSGFGRNQHYVNLRKFEDVEIVAICEPMAERREEYAREFEIPHQYENHIEMLENETPDAVYAVMAPHRSFDVARHCISEGMSIFLEKPAVMTSYQAECLANAAAKSGALTMVGFNRRFMPILREAKKRVLAGGELAHCVATFYKHGPDASYYGGAVSYLRCDAVHSVDALRWMGGEVESVASVLGTYGAETFNAASAVVRFESGATGVLITNWSTATRVHTFEMHSLNCSAFVNPDEETVIYTSGAKPTDPPEKALLDAAEIAGGSERPVQFGFEGEDRHFIDCVKEKREPETNLADVLKTHRLVDEIMRRNI